MTEQSLKITASRAMIWNAIEKFSVQGGRFVFTVVLARLLLPADFGLIGMLSIFIAISQSFIESGMGMGLVQKQDRTEADYSTVFIYNLSVSIIFYLIIYLTAPLIADFYETPQLVVLARVLSINLIINSLSMIQLTRLTIRLDFKSIAKVNIITMLTGGIFGVYFAVTGYGVWALVIQNLVSAVCAAIIYWYLSSWRPSLIFSRQSFTNLFGFGSKLLLASIYAQIFNNIYNMIIGKAYSVSELGYYTRARGLAELAASTIASIVQQVSFPLLSSLKEDQTAMVSAYSNLVRTTAFIILPTMTMISVLADPFVRLILTDKWLPVIPLLQLMSFARIFYPMSVINMNILNAIGRSDLYLKVDLSKLPLMIIILMITVPLGVKAMVMGHVIMAFASFFINAYLPGKLFGYGARQQLGDMRKAMIATGITALLVYILISFTDSLYLKLLVGSLSGVSLYIFISHILHIDELYEIRDLILKVKN